MKKKTFIRQACRYSYTCYPGMDIKQSLILNPWLFDMSFSFMAFYDVNTALPLNVFEADKNWAAENFVVFTGANDSFENNIDKIDWNNFGTWYINLYPGEIVNEKTVMLGIDTFLNEPNEVDSVGYFNLSEEWRFMHTMQPDIFVSTQKNGVMIGALSELNLLRIKSK